MRSVHKSKDPTPRQSFKGFIAEGMAFEVPSWLDSGMPARLGADPAEETWLVPNNTVHRFERVFKGKFGENAMIDVHGDAKVHTEPIMTVVQKLANAKRNAADAMKNMDGSEKACTEIIEAERNVVRERVNLLKTLMQEEDANLCIQSPVSPYDMKTSVEYRRMTIQDLNMLKAYEVLQPDIKMFPTQSTMAWNGGAELKWTDIGQMFQLTKQEDKSALSPSLNSIIQQAVTHANKDGSTATLRALVNRTGKAVFNHVQYTNPHLGAFWHVPEASQASEHFFTSTVEDGTDEPIHLAVIIGVLDINYCEAWQNPVINKFVQQAVQNAGLTALEMIQDSDEQVKNRLMWNTLRPTIRIAKGDDVHILTLAPYANPDCCTVLHLYSDPEQQGICNLNDFTTEDVPTCDMNMYTPPMRVYHCVGAHRRVRFNEQELNYIHETALRASYEGIGVNGVENDELPWGRDLNFEDEDYVRAKSARISFSDWDVLVTSVLNNTVDSLHYNNNEKTVITLVNYPPTGTRYTPDKPNKTLNPKAEEFGPKGEQQRHAWHQPSGRVSSWDRPPKEGHMYFIPGLYMSEFTNREWHVYMIDTDPAQAGTLTLMREAKTIRDNIWSIYSTVWDTTRQNMWQFNIERNTTKPEGVAQSIHSYYVAEWSKVLHKWVTSALAELDSGEGQQASCYLYCPRGKHLWKHLLNISPTSERHMTEAEIDRWVDYSDERYKQDVVNRRIKPVLLDSYDNGHTRHRGYERPSHRGYERPAQRGYERPAIETHSWPTPDDAFIHNGATYCIPGVTDINKTYWVMMDLNCMFFMIDTSDDQEDARECMVQGQAIRRKLSQQYFITLVSGEAGYYAELQKKKPALIAYTEEWIKYIRHVIGRECKIDPNTEQPYFKAKTTGGYFFCHDINNWKNVFTEMEDTAKEWVAYSAARYEEDKGKPNVRVELSDVIGKKREPREFVPGNRAGWAPPPPPPRPTSPIMPPTTTPTPYADYTSKNKLYYIPGVGSGEDYMDKKYNVYVIDSAGESALSELMIGKAETIKTALRGEFVGEWVETAKSMGDETELYTNVEREADNSYDDFGTTREEYAKKWKIVLTDWIVSNLDTDDDTFSSTDGFLYCSDPSIWKEILDTDEYHLSEAWITHMDKMFDATQPNLHGPRTAQGMIALPPDRVRQPVLARIHTDPETTNTVAQLRERVAALETKLDRSHQDANRDHLMQQLLARMNAM